MLPNVVESPDPSDGVQIGLTKAFLKSVTLTSIVGTGTTEEQATAKGAWEMDKGSGYAPLPDDGTDISNLNNVKFRLAPVNLLEHTIWRNFHWINCYRNSYYNYFNVKRRNNSN